MGSLKALCRARFSDMYGPLLHLGEHSRPIFELLADTPADLEDLRQLLQEGWREHLVGGVAALFHPERLACRELLWEAFDRGSWVAPQLAFCALALDPGDLDEARRRLLLRCPVKSEHLAGLDPMVRHVEHGTAAIQQHNQKGMAALLATFARHEKGRAWLSARLPLEDAFWALEVDTWDHGDDLARRWGDKARAILGGMGRPLPDWLEGEVPERLLDLWTLEGQPPAVRLLCTGSWESRLYRLLQAPYQKGHRSLLLEKGRLLAREVSGNRVLLELPPAFLEGARSTCASGPGTGPWTCGSTAASRRL